MVSYRSFSVAIFLKARLSNPFIIIIIIIIMLAPLCRVFTIIYLKQTVFLGCIVMRLFCIYILCTSNVISHVKYVLYSYINTFRIMCAVPSMTVVCSSLLLLLLLLLLSLLLSSSSSSLSSSSSFSLPALGQTEPPTRPPCSTEHSLHLMPLLRMPWYITYFHFPIRFMLRRLITHRDNFTLPLSTITNNTIW